MNEDQDSSTRSVIVKMLKAKGSLSVKQITKELGITEMAVRRHLGTLERDGLIGSRLIRQATGRPSHIYSLTELAEEKFPKKYHSLTLDLLSALSEEAGEGMIELLFEKRKQKLLEKYQGSMENKPLAERVAALAEIQNENGYMVEWETDENGEFVLKEYNCPISQVAKQYDHACQCELKLFESLLNANVERTECLAKSGKKCVYVIQKSAK